MLTLQKVLFIVELGQLAICELFRIEDNWDCSLFFFWLEFAFWEDISEANTAVDDMLNKVCNCY